MHLAFLITLTVGIFHLILDIYHNLLALQYPPVRVTQGVFARIARRQVSRLQHHIVACRDGDGVFGRVFRGPGPSGLGALRPVCVAATLVVSSADGVEVTEQGAQHWDGGRHDGDARLGGTPLDEADGDDCRMLVLASVSRRPR